MVSRGAFPAAVHQQMQNIPGYANVFLWTPTWIR